MSFFSAVEKLDKKDRRILYELDMQLRQSSAQIARKVGLSETAVKYRIRKMIRQGVIKRFYTLIDVSKLGYSGFRVYLKLMDISPEEQAEFIQFLVKQPSIFWVNTYLHGAWDVGCHIWAKDVHEFHMIWMKVLDKFKPSIKEEQISQHLKILHYRRDYLLSKRRENHSAIGVGGSSKLDTDKIDWEILRILSHDAQKPLVEIARELNLTPTTIKNRITKLIKNKVILGIRPMINLGALGYEWYKLNLYLRDLKRKKQLFYYIQENPHTVHVYNAIGLSDFEIGLEVEDVNQFYAILEDIRQKFSDCIRDYDYFLIFKEHKLLFIPQE